MNLGKPRNNLIAGLEIITLIFIAMYFFVFLWAHLADFQWQIAVFTFLFHFQKEKKQLNLQKYVLIILLLKVSFGPIFIKY